MNRKAIERMDRLVERGVREAVAEAIREHARAGRKVAIWRNGRVAIVPARTLVGRKRVRCR